MKTGLMRLIPLAAIVLACLGAGAVPCRAGADFAPLGLNIVPTARMDRAGTVSLSVSTLDPYAHAVLGVQFAAPLFIGLRQTALMSGLNDGADRLYPGVDVRLRLAEERAHRPALVLGLPGALGHRRMAGEYLAASKRFGAFDLTAGIGWGRMGAGGHLPNPLAALAGHFGRRRAPDGEDPNGPAHWFTGAHTGLFGGAAYDTPWKGLSVRADWNAEGWTAARAGTDFRPPGRWSAGLHYAPAPWAAIGAAVVEGPKIAASLTLRAPAARWPGRTHKDTAAPPLRPYRTGPFFPAEMTRAAERDGTGLYAAEGGNYMAAARLRLDPARSLPLQAGRAARAMANHAGRDAEALRMTPVSGGLEGPVLSLPRRALERALAAGRQGSPQEIWRKTAFFPAGTVPLRDRFDAPVSDTIRLRLDTQVSLAEEDSGLLYRTGLLLEETRTLSERFTAGGGIRLGLAGNLAHLNDSRAQALLPVRGDVDRFAARHVTPERAWLGWMTTLRPGLHLGMKTGYLEEMYAGAGGEILYRPFGRRFALGAEAWQVFKRAPDTPFALGLSGDRLLTGHVNAWYDIPGTGLTFQARAGRYLAEDVGGTLAVERRFSGGAALRAFVTATTAADPDSFGDLMPVYSGLSLTLPLGNVPRVPENSVLTVRAAPFGRNAGQTLEPPLPLYAASEPLTLRHIADHWREILE